MKPHYIKRSDTASGGDGDRDMLASVHEASAESVDYVLKQSTTSGDGRSPWVWVRLANGDLILGVFPQGDTYFSVEHDAQFPGVEPTGAVMEDGTRLDTWDERLRTVGGISTND